MLPPCAGVRGLLRVGLAVLVTASVALNQDSPPGSPPVPRPQGHDHPTPIAPLAAQLPAPSVHSKVRRGWACQHTASGQRWAVAGALSATGLLEGPVTVGVTGSLELSVPGAWRAVVAGPAKLEAEHRAGRADLCVEGVQQLLLDVSTECRVELPGGQRLRLLRGLVELRRTPDGGYGFTHHGGLPVEVDLGGPYTLVWRAGTRRSVPPRLTAGPALRSGLQLAPGNYRTLPQRADGRVPADLVPAERSGPLAGLWPF
jgi:hypothetical protein